MKTSKANQHLTSLIDVDSRFGSTLQGPVSEIWVWLWEVTGSRSRGKTTHTQVAKNRIGYAQGAVRCA